MADAVRAALSPRIAVVESSDVTELCATRLGLPNLATLLQPWQLAGVERVSLRSATFETTDAPTFPLRIDPAGAVEEEGPWEREGGWLDSLTADLNARLDQWLPAASLGQHRGEPRVPSRSLPSWQLIGEQATALGTITSNASCSRCDR